MTTLTVDEPGTWPDSVLEAATVLTAKLPDDVLDFDADDEFRELFAGHLVRAYHCTRLLESEVDAIHDNGLAPLTEELVQQRLDGALRNADITEKEREVLRHANIFRDRGQRSRRGLVHLFVSERALHRGRGLNSLLGIWGGEGITMSHGAQPHLVRLRGIGRPAIVVVEVGVGPETPVSPHPPLWTAFARRLRSPEDDYSVTLHCRAAIPRVAAIWTLGSPEYDRFPRLTRR